MIFSVSLGKLFSASQLVVNETTWKVLDSFGLGETFVKGVSFVSCKITRRFGFPVQGPIGNGLSGNGICHPVSHRYLLLFKKKKIQLFFYCSITVVCIFSPSLHPTPAKPTSLPRLHPPPWFCPCVLYSSSCKPLSPLSPPHSPLAIVRLFLTSLSLVRVCLLVCFVD